APAVEGRDFGSRERIVVDPHVIDLSVELTRGGAALNCRAHPCGPRRAHGAEATERGLRYEGAVLVHLELPGSAIDDRHQMHPGVVDRSRGEDAVHTIRSVADIGVPVRAAQLHVETDPTQARAALPPRHIP